jgi:hypothetical protein
MHEKDGKGDDGNFDSGNETTHGCFLRFWGGVRLNSEDTRYGGRSKNFFGARQELLAHKDFVHTLARRLVGLNDDENAATVEVDGHDTVVHFDL